jgi:hypothetical protein
MEHMFITRVEGATLGARSPDPQTTTVQVAVLGHTKPPTAGQAPVPWRLTLPLLDALYLLNVLEDMSKRGGFDHLRRPPQGTPN